MALLWLEGFEVDKNATDAARKYESATGFSGTTGGRWTGSALRVDNANVQLRTKNLGNKANAIVGCNLKWIGAGANNAETLLFRFLDGTNEQISLYWLTDGLGYFKFRVKRGSTTIGTTTNSWNPIFWLLLEFKVVLDTNGADGSVEILVNGVSELLVQNIDTTNFASLVWNRLLISGTAPFSNVFSIDDVYLIDLSGGTNNTYLGEIVVEAVTPNGNGNRNQWDTGPTPGGGNHYTFVQDGTIDDDATYLFVWNSDDDKVELFAMTDMAVMVNPVYGVLLEYDMRMDNPGASDHFSTIFRSGGGSEATGSTQTINTSASYVRFIDILEQDPVAAAAWTVANLNAMQMGIKSLA